MKKEFIYNEIWTLTFGAAFQRAKVYSENVSDNDKQTLKREIRRFIEDDLFPKYKMKGISDNEHLQSIQELSDFTKRFNSILDKNKLNYGVSQKLLNLFLKYRWCLNEIPAPPHFPLDRRIQENLNLEVISWTKLDSSKKYLEIINKVRALNLDFKSLAELELYHFERRLKTK